MRCKLIRVSGDIPAKGHLICYSILFTCCIILPLLLTGCDKSNTVESCIVANESYETKTDIEDAIQPDHVAAEKEVYASVYFIESPKGMEYTVKWYADGEAIKTEDKKMTEDKHGMIIYTLEAQKVVGKKLKCEILYRDEVLNTVELPIQ